MSCNDEHDVDSYDDNDYDNVDDGDVNYDNVSIVYILFFYFFMYDNYVDNYIGYEWNYVGLLRT